MPEDDALFIHHYFTALKAIKVVGLVVQNLVIIVTKGTPPSFDDSLDGYCYCIEDCNILYERLLQNV
jgi:hypothetical protein